ncbi:hypothetical protein [Macrococcus carouselicus]|nr:hypothetical protein [Macrococcus carouselicus]
MKYNIEELSKEYDKAVANDYVIDTSEGLLLRVVLDDRVYLVDRV